MNRIYFIIATLLVVFSGCTTTPPLNDFTYTYSMENVNNFKIEFQLNSDATFKITQYNFFFDNFEKSKKPFTTEGTLESNEFSTFKQLLQQSNIHEMDDSYGFDENTASEADILYMIELKQDGKSKYVSINDNDANSFSEKFTELISYTTKIISTKNKAE